MVGRVGRGLLVGAGALLALAGGALGAAAADDSLDLLLDAIVQVEEEVMLLVELDAFDEPLEAVVTAAHRDWADLAGGLARVELLEWLDESDRAGTRVLDALLAEGIPVSAAITDVLGPLPAADRDALLRLQPIQTDQHRYARALEDLWDLELGDGSWLGSGPLSLPWAVMAAAVGLLAIGVGVGRRVRGRDARPSDGGRSDVEVDAGSGPVDGPTFDRLLDASRRMTGTLQADEVIRIAVDEASELTDARAGAFVRVRLTGGEPRFEVAHSPQGLLNRAQLADGILRRVAETGQTARLVVYDEPALASLPVSLLAVSMIFNGGVVGLLVVVREVERPFAAAEESILRQLAPMAASALRSAEEHGSVAARSLIDGLTGLANRRCLDEQLPAALDELGRADTLAVAMVDVDHFKAFNDREGHAAGDRALTAVAAALRAEVRDHAYRYGGEEFAVVLREVTPAQAEAALERVRAAIERTPVDGAAGQPQGALTVSIGAVVVAAGVEAATALELADEQLYAAKREGRNRVRVDVSTRIARPDPTGVG